MTSEPRQLPTLPPPPPPMVKPYNLIASIPMEHPTQLDVNMFSGSQLDEYLNSLADMDSCSEGCIEEESEMEGLLDVYSVGVMTSDILYIYYCCDICYFFALFEFAWYDGHVCRV